MKSCSIHTNKNREEVTFVICLCICTCISCRYWCIGPSSVQSLHESTSAELEEHRQLLRTSGNVQEHNVTLQVGGGRGATSVLHGGRHVVQSTVYQCGPGVGQCRWTRCDCCVSLGPVQERIAGLECQLTQQRVEVRFSRFCVQMYIRTVDMCTNVRKYVHTCILHAYCMYAGVHLGGSLA